MVNKCFVLHEDFMDIFNDKIYIPTIEKLSFDLAHVRILGSMKFRNAKNYYSNDNVSIIDLYLDKHSAEKFNKKTGI